jgi:chemotaxis protein methyltransferase CheR
MLKKAVQAISAAACRMDLPAFLEKILPPSDNQLYKTLLTHLTIGETYFLSGQAYVSAVKGSDYAGSAITTACKNQPVNILSAGCASGEEPYSVAILIDQAFPPDPEKRLPSSEPILIRCFWKKPKKEFIRAGPSGKPRMPSSPIISRRCKTDTLNSPTHIREKVRFRRLNLMKKDYPAQLHVQEPFHIIFCRNVLMYFMEPAEETLWKG